MRILRALILMLITAVLVFLLDKPLGSLPALGKLLDPINGCMANAEYTSKNFSQVSHISGLQQPVRVWLDDRLVPHIHAANDHDLYFTQGYVHAYFRLWQMDMQTRAAAGRICEVIGDKALNFDRGQRRKGMVYAAENSLKAIEAEPRTKQMMDAYTAGINNYISSLQYRELPIEYKLMGFTPEPWTNIKGALLLKYMADDLTGYTEDIPLSVLKDMLSKEDMELLYPERIMNSTSVIPAGTSFTPPSLLAHSAPATDVWSHFTRSGIASIPYAEKEGIGSNNWAVGSGRTANGAPILCNDPHLGLNLPSLWFEVQLQTPDMNVYGVSLPGAPGVVIGFNDNISWGLTNNYRDVKDFYEITATGSTSYLFNGKHVPFTKRVEVIKIKGKDDVRDTVLYTIHGPVMYDEGFEDPARSKKKLAMCWMAHRPTNEMLSLYQLDRAKNYTEFVSAIQHFECPAQNVVYADKLGNVSLWGQGQFVNKWKDQGRYVMEGKDSLTMWKELIPMSENPHVMNPAQGYVSSANQTVTDSTYPYWYNGYFYEFRAWRINDVLSKTDHATIKDMFSLQNDVYSVLASKILPTLLTHFDNPSTNQQEKLYIDDLKKWDYRLTVNSKEATVFQIWWSMFYDGLWSGRFSKVPEQLYPSPEHTLELLKASNPHIFTSANAVFETELSKLVMQSWAHTMDSVHKLERTTGTEWYKVKNTTVKHLAKLPAFSYPNLKIGGWGNVVNAAKGDHGPSWRMVVQMSKQIDAYGVYPGGQSGNPGSKYYATFLDHWVEGKYYKLQFLPNQSEQKNPSIQYTWTLQP